MTTTFLPLSSNCLPPCVAPVRAADVPAIRWPLSCDANGHD